MSSKFSKLLNICDWDLNLSRELTLPISTFTFLNATTEASYLKSTGVLMARCETTFQLDQVTSSLTKCHNLMYEGCYLKRKALSSWDSVEQKGLEEHAAVRIPVVLEKSLDRW